MHRITVSDLAGQTSGQQGLLTTTVNIITSSQNDGQQVIINSVSIMNNLPGETQNVLWPVSGQNIGQQNLVTTVNQVTPNFGQFPQVTECCHNVLCPVSDQSIGPQNSLPTVNQVTSNFSPLSEGFQNVPNSVSGENSGPQNLLTSVNPITSNFGPFSQVTELDKRRYRQQLVLLLHAYKCQKRETTNCYLSQCDGMRQVLIHIQFCQSGNTCTVPKCVSSKALILHWKDCSQNDCALCFSLKPGTFQRQQQVPGSQCTFNGQNNGQQDLINAVNIVPNQPNSSQNIVGPVSGQSIGQQNLRTPVNRVDSIAGPYSQVTGLEKLTQKQHLIFLLHAYKCQKRDAANGDIRAKCYLKHCQRMKKVLVHIKTCRSGNTCAVSDCVPTKILILHWKDCLQKECTLCFPLKKQPNICKLEQDFKMMSL